MGAPATIDTALERYRDHRIDFADRMAPHTYEGIHKDYDASYEGPEDGWVASHPVHTGDTLDEVRAEIDAWQDEQVSAYLPGLCDCTYPKQAVRQRSVERLAINLRSFARIYDDPTEEQALDAARDILTALAESASQ